MGLKKQVRKAEAEFILCSMFTDQMLYELQATPEWEDYQNAIKAEQEARETFMELRLEQLNG